MRYVTHLLCLIIVSATAGIWPLRVSAQTQATPALDIIAVNRTQFPTIQLTLVGSHLPADIDTLPVKLFEGNQAQTIVTDQVEQRGLQVAIVVDPHDLLALGRSGQTHQAEVHGATLELIERQAITRNVDLLAAYTSQAYGELQTIQDWTGEPNLIFNNLVQSKIEDAGTEKGPAALLLQAMDTFPTPAPAGVLARSIILFSSGVTSFTLEAVVAKANALHIRIHTVELVGPDQEEPQAASLQQLAQRTQGQFVFLTSTRDLAPLADGLNELRQQRILTYATNKTTLTPLNVRLTLPNQANLEASFVPTEEESISRSAVVSATAASTSASRTVSVSNTAASTVATAVITGTLSVANSTAKPAATSLPAATAVATTVAQPAVLTSAATLAIAPVASVVETSSAGVTAGSLLGLPRLAWLITLPVLILLAAYLGYQGVRARRARKAQPTRLNRRMDAKDSRLFALSDPDEELKPLPKNKTKTGHFDLQTDEELQANATESSQPLLPNRGRVDERREVIDDELTSVPWPALGDDDATYRLPEAIEQPIIGYFIRVTSDPNLPSELPLYGLNPVRGELRQIHIGRHSKNNTVVINDKNISREHAVIVQKEGRLYLRDNASTAGTFLNWKRLKPGEELLLRHNDIVSFGEIVYEFRAKGEDEATVVGE